MEIKKLSFLLLLVCCFSIYYSCEDKKSTQNTSIEDIEKQDSLGIKLSIVPYQKVVLNPKLDSVIMKWPTYNTVKNEVNRLENYTIQDVISNMVTIEKAVDSLQYKVPKEIDTLPVLSRINVLKSKAKYMLMMSEKQKPKLKQIKQMAEEFPLEFNALKIQLNELYIEIPNFENQ